MDNCEGQNTSRSYVYLIGIKVDITSIILGQFYYFKTTYLLFVYVIKL